MQMSYLENIKEIFLPKTGSEKSNFCKIQGMSKGQNYMAMCNRVTFMTKMLAIKMRNIHKTLGHLDARLVSFLSFLCSF